MILISVLAALALDHFLLAHRDSRVGRWFGKAIDAAAARLPSTWEGVGAALLVSAPPVVVMLLLQWLLAGWLYGLASLALAIVVLLLCLGPIDVVSHVGDYIEARRDDDAERVAWNFERVTGEMPPSESRDEGRRMVEAVLYQGHDNLFATVFWFCLLGPTGAVLYRMAAEGALRPPPAIVARPGLHASLRYMLGILGWIPARLVAFGYAMTGRFEEAFARLRLHVLVAGDDVLGANRRLLIDTGGAALRQEDSEPLADVGAERRSSDAGGVVEAARALALRTAVLWLAVLALLTLGGWFG